MKFDDAQVVEQLCYQLRDSDWPRSRNRARINEIFDGFPPFTGKEVEENQINCNFSDLTATRKAHDARGQMYSAILKPGNYFRAIADIGPVHKRSEFSEIVTRRANRLLKRSLPYYELQRAKIAQSILHGIGMSVWPDREQWRPRAMSIEDVLIPSGEASELPMEDLPLFAIHKSFTAKALIELTRGPNVDSGWNMTMVKACLKWIDEQATALMNNNWPANWSPEKFEERIKESSFYGGDSVPTIEVYDFYWWEDDKVKGGTQSGWKRRMIIDPWGTPSMTGKEFKPSRKTGTLYEDSKLKSQFLYDPGDRIFAGNKSEIISFQFADLSAVAPFKYHTIRGLGYLLHDACHIQNRLSCKITEATFETLTMLMRVKTADDVQRALKANLFNLGFVDESVTFIPNAERWQVNTGLVEYGYNKNRESIEQGSLSFSQSQDMSKGVEKGQLQIMAELNATTALLSAGLLQYYRYQKGEYVEIFRRLLNGKADCCDAEVNAFRAGCLKDEVPVEMLNDPEGWDIEPEQVMGAGNKTLEMAIAGQLMQYRSLYDPPAQRKILRDVTLAVTDDPARANELVPREPVVSDTVHDTELVFSALMGGRAVTPKSGLNAVEVAGKTIELMGQEVQKIMQSGGVGTPQDIEGLSMAAGYATHFLKILEQDKESKQIVTALNQQLSKIGNAIKGLQQRQQEAMQAAAQNGDGGGLPPEAQAKVASIEATTQAKIESGKISHAEKTAQKQVTFDQKMEMEREKHKMELEKMRLEFAAELDKKELELASAVRQNGKKSESGGGEGE